MQRRWIFLAATALLAGALVIATGLAYARGTFPPAGTTAAGPRNRQPGPPYAGTVTAAGGDSISLHREAGDLTVRVSAQTTFDLGPKVSGTLADVQVGDRIGVQGSLAGSTLNATRVQVHLVEARGVIASRSDSSITLSHGIWTANVTLTQQTTVHNLQGPGSLQDLAVGQEVAALGRVSGGALVARVVESVPARLDGEVTAKGDNTLTIRTPAGDRTATVNSATVYRDDLAGGGFKQIAVGDRLHLEGVQDGSSFTALTVARASRHTPRGRGSWDRQGPPDREPGTRLPDR